MLCRYQSTAFDYSTVEKKDVYHIRKTKLVIFHISAIYGIIRRQLCSGNGKFVILIINIE